MDTDFNYRKLAMAHLYLEKKECLFLATNDDLTYPSGEWVYELHGLIHYSRDDPVKNSSLMIIELRTLLS